MSMIMLINVLFNYITLIDDSISIKQKKNNQNQLLKEKKRRVKEYNLTRCLIHLSIPLSSSEEIQCKTKSKNEVEIIEKLFVKMFSLCKTMLILTLINPSIISLLLYYLILSFTIF